MSSDSKDNEKESDEPYNTNPEIILKDSQDSKLLVVIHSYLL